MLLANMLTSLSREPQLFKSAQKHPDHMFYPETTARVRSVLMLLYAQLVSQSAGALSCKKSSLTSRPKPVYKYSFSQIVTMLCDSFFSAGPPVLKSSGDSFFNESKHLVERNG